MTWEDATEKLDAAVKGTPVKYELSRHTWRDGVVRGDGFLLSLANGEVLTDDDRRRFEIKKGDDQLEMAIASAVDQIRNWTN